MAKLWGTATIFDDGGAAARGSALREKTGSVWATSLAHAATNAIGGTLTVLWFPDRAHWLFVSYLSVLGWIPLGLISLWIIVGRNGTRGVALESEARA
ncbi:MAG TPA: hypothetical protein VMU22_10140 [Rhizomicrobium sp.]|nr:hypothetical protein [Rhizomicrobium sp.]